MKKTIAIMVIGMFIIVGCGSAVIGDDDDPIGSNRPPSAPVLIQDKSDWEEEYYTYAFYAKDPDGDQVYYDVAWKKVGESTIISCEPDDPVVPWLGPYDSGQELEKTHRFDKLGKYELTIRAKDIYDSIGPSTTITVTYKSSIFQLPIFSQLIEKYPVIFDILAKIF